MPLYEFKCKECGCEFEKQQRMEEEHVSNCPDCNSNDTTRRYSSISINIISDKDLSARLQGVPKKRLDMTKYLKDEREKRKKDPQSEKEAKTNELHPNTRKTNIKY